MKRNIIVIAALLAAGIFSGCRSRTAEIISVTPPPAVRQMTLEQARSIVAGALTNLSRGGNSQYSGFEYVGKYARSVVLTDNPDSGYCLVEVHNKSRAFLKFYLANREDAEKFVAAVQRLVQEYQR